MSDLLLFMNYRVKISLDFIFISTVEYVACLPAEDCFQSNLIKDFLKAFPSLHRIGNSFSILSQFTIKIAEEKRINITHG